MLSTNCSRQRTNSRGSVRCGKWPAPSNEWKTLPGIRSCAARPCATGMIGSFSPHSTIVGTRWARYRRSVAFTRWPPGSTIPRSVWMNAPRAPTSLREEKPRHISSRSGPACSPSRPRNEPIELVAFSSRDDASSGSTSSESGRVAARNIGLHLAPEAAARDQHEPLAALRELVGHLHRHAAAERVADDRAAVVAERAEEVANAAGVGAERVVAARLRRFAVAEQVGRDDGVVLRERLHHVRPRLRAAGDPVDQHQHGTPARAAVTHCVSVESDLLVVHLRTAPLAPRTRAAYLAGGLRMVQPN